MNFVPLQRLQPGSQIIRQPLAFEDLANPLFRLDLVARVGIARIGSQRQGLFVLTAEVMQVVVDNRMAHFGTYNGNPLCMAAAKAVLGEVCTPEVTQATIALNRRVLDACQKTIEDADLPAHTVQFGAKGCVTWAPTPIQNYRDYKSTDFDLAFAQWMHGINRGVLLPPGLDEQWLISVMHSESDAMHYSDVFAEFVAELVS